MCTGLEYMAFSWPISATKFTNLKIKLKIKKKTENCKIQFNMFINYKSYQKVKTTWIILIAFILISNTEITKTYFKPLQAPWLRIWSYFQSFSSKVFDRLIQVIHSSEAEPDRNRVPEKKRKPNKINSTLRYHRIDSCFFVITGEPSTTNRFTHKIPYQTHGQKKAKFVSFTRRFLMFQFILSLQKSLYQAHCNFNAYRKLVAASVTMVTSIYIYIFYMHDSTCTKCNIHCIKYIVLQLNSLKNIVRGEDTVHLNICLSLNIAIAQVIIWLM